MVKAPTERQHAALAAIHEGQVKMVRHGYAAFRIHGPAHPSVVGLCIKNGWAFWPKGYAGEQVCILTDQGRLQLDITSGVHT